MVFAGLINGARHARWLTRERIVAGGQILLLIELTILVLLALWQHGVISDRVTPTSSDFVSFYAAGKLALAHTPGLAYDQAAHFLTEQQFTVTGAPYQYFFYPPVFLLLCAPLAVLPYYVAFYGFEIATLAAFTFTMRQILREPGWSWMGPVLAFPAIFWTFGLGQNAFLTAALFGGFTLLIDRRPSAAGMCLGLLCYKPHFGLLAPVALVAGGLWRPFLVAAATVAGLVLLVGRVVRSGHVAGIFFGIRRVQRSLCLGPDRLRRHCNAFRGGTAVGSCSVAVLAGAGAGDRCNGGRGRVDLAALSDPEPARRDAPRGDHVGSPGSAVVRPAPAVGGNRLACARRPQHRLSSLGKDRVACGLSWFPAGLCCVDSELHQAARPIDQLCGASGGGGGLLVVRRVGA